MKHFKTMLRMFTVLAILALFTLPAAAADDLNVYPTETTGGEVSTGDGLMALYSSDPVPTYTITDDGLAFIISYEGFFANPYWDYSRYSIGHGNSYDAAKELFGEDCAPITKEQAFELLKSEIVSTENYMNKFFVKNNIVLNQNQYDALLSFTYNVGIGWTTYKNSDGTWCKLKTMLLDDPSTWTEERAQAAFGSWVSAGGQVLSGLVKRRAAEATLFCTPYTALPENTPEEKPEPTQPAGFSDVAEDAWYYTSIVEVCDLGLMNGMGDGTFQPEGTLTRAQMVKILYNFDGQTAQNTDADTGFTDVPAGAWYSAPIAWAVEHGYVNGMGNGTFQPDAPITREQMCTILTRYLTDKGFAVEGKIATFADDAKISGFAKESVYFCATAGLIQGMGNGLFAPAESATRAQAATVFLRLYGLG